ncbi:CCA tRNA nucleotidyltransferase [Candidatus Peregrinibacteria bacterium]|nr:CCA tRNA nucleotidyltransferase [Candidatus Peregrinibacteria bacterium]
MQQTALQIVKTLQNAGYIAYFAGGAVRDILLGNSPDDIDIATNAKPEEIEKLFAKTYSIGKHFGVILVEENGHHFEIATFRSDAGYTDGRRPNAVFFTDAKEDAFRRDFTINGMFFDPISDELHDFVGGEKDLKRKILRFIGNAEERIRDDHLRILRAVRFKNRFQLKYESKTKKALMLHSSLIVHISAERVQEELTKMLLRFSRKQAFQDLLDLGILEHIIPELTELKNTPQPKNFHSEGDVLIHTFMVIAKLPEHPSLELAWAALFHDIGKAKAISYREKRIRFPNHEVFGEEISKKILKRLKFSNFSLGKICWLVKHHQLFDVFENMKWSTKLHYFDHPFFEDLLLLHHADLYGSLPSRAHVHEQGENNLSGIKAEYERAHFDNLLPSAQPELLSGKEIMKILNIPPSKKIGEIKAALREAQLNGKILDALSARKWILKKYSS